VKIFLSYSRDDAGNIAKHIHRYLRNSGQDVFIDVNSIRIGEPWADSIEKNISECDIFVIILTPDSLRSGHVEREILQAQRENKIIVPCINEHIDYNEIRWGLEKIQGIEFLDKEDLVIKLYSKIKDYKNFEKPEESTDIVKGKVESNKKKKHVKLDRNRKSQPKKFKIIIILIVSVVIIGFVVYQSYIESILDKVRNLNKKGLESNEQGKYQEAIDYYDKALELDPNYVSALNNKGVALKKQGKYQEAIDYYDKALELDPNYVSALDNKGQVFEEQGKYQEAIAWFDKALKVNPNYEESLTNKVNALNNKGNALLELGNYNEGIKYYDKVLEIDPNNEYALANTGWALNQQGKYQEAIEYYDKALEIDPKNKKIQKNKEIALKGVQQLK
jgi:tetratricopeptide (TPR) repeat protein